MALESLTKPFRQEKCWSVACLQDVSHSFWLIAGTSQFQGQLINFCKNLAIWGGLVFIAGTTNQPSLLPRKKILPLTSV